SSFRVPRCRVVFIGRLMVVLSQELVLQSLAIVFSFFRMIDAGCSEQSWYPDFCKVEMVGPEVITRNWIGFPCDVPADLFGFFPEVILKLRLAIADHHDVFHFSICAQPI